MQRSPGWTLLGEHPDAPSEVWHLSNAPETRTTRELVDMVFSLAGQPRSRLRRLPPLLLRGLGLFNPTIRELLEMQYQFEEPFIVDSSKIAARLGISATPLAAAIAETLEAYKAGGRTHRNPGKLELPL